MACATTSPGTIRVTITCGCTNTSALSNTRPPGTGEAFGVRPSFLALWVDDNSRAQEISPKCESGRRNSRAPRRWREIGTRLDIGEAFGVRLSFLALFELASVHTWQITPRCKSGTRDSRT